MHGAALIPRAVVEARATFTTHTNSHKFLLQDDVWNAAGVIDVTERLRNVHLYPGHLSTVLRVGETYYGGLVPHS